MFNANTILNQLGGNKFIVMTGAKNIMKSDAEKSLSFLIGKNSKQIKWVKILYNEGEDSYTMEFYRVKKSVPTLASRHEQIHAAQMTGIFTDETGMYTRL